MKERLGEPQIKPNPKHAGGTHYQDIDGNPITKAQYEKLQADIAKQAKAADAKLAQQQNDKGAK